MEVRPLTDADPHREGLPVPKVQPINAKSAKAKKAAKLVEAFYEAALPLLAKRTPANGMLLRGLAHQPEIPAFAIRYGLRAACLAVYPMYKGLARLVGMEILDGGATLADQMATLKKAWANHDFFFLHFKYTDTTGEDGVFDSKVAVIEEVDRSLPDLLVLGPDVIAVTGDHSTPSVLTMHSWNAVPFVLRSRYEVPDAVEQFTERACQRGTLGRFPAQQVMLLLMGNALKLEKFGA